MCANFLDVLCVVLVICEHSILYRCSIFSFLDRIFSFLLSHFIILLGINIFLAGGLLLCAARNWIAARNWTCVKKLYHLGGCI